MKSSKKVGLEFPSATIIHGECITEMRKMPDNSIDSIVCDPPYGLGFLGLDWDASPPGLEWAEECLRVLKPGGHLVAFGGSRTWHRLAVAVEDAGFEIRDSIAWLYNSGVPKNMNISKSIDQGSAVSRARQLIFTAWMRGTGITAKTINAVSGTTMASHYLTDKQQPAIADAVRFDTLRPYLPQVPEYIERLVAERTGIERSDHQKYEHVTYTPLAARWRGWGTALKPAFEPCVVARKPISEKTVAANVLRHGTGAINIDSNRIQAADAPEGRVRHGGGIPGNCSSFELPDVRPSSPAGRWPANVMLDEAMAEVLDAQSGISKSNVRVSEDKDVSGVTFSLGRSGVTPRGVADSGGASRFFYVAKASKSERPLVDGVAHPTVKPLTLMRTLVSLFTPPGGIVLDTFAGSGTTVEAALLEGFNVIGIEMTDEYLPLIQSRIDRVA